MESIGKLNSERGVATLIALIMVGMLMLIGLVALSTSEDEQTIAGNSLQEMRAFYVAEAGFERMAAFMQQEYDTDLDDPNRLPPETPVVRVFQRTGWRQEHVSLEQ